MTRSAVILGTAVVLWSGAARAQAEVPTRTEGSKSDSAFSSGPSAQRFSLEVKFAPFLPSIDDFAKSDPRATPFRDQFGDPLTGGLSRDLMGQVEFDYHFLRRFGELGIGFSGGYYRKTARQLAYLGVGGGGASGPYTTCTPSYRGAPVSPEDPYILPTGYSVGVGPGVDGRADAIRAVCLSGDEQLLNVVPLSLMLVYRFDYLDVRWGIPLIPYMKVGLAYYIWWLGAGGEFVTHRNVGSGAGGLSPLTDATQRVELSGASWGLVLHPGLALDLGVLDRQAARILDQETGINRFTVFAELQYGWVNGFGAANKLNLSDLTFNAGIGAEF